MLSVNRISIITKYKLLMVQNVIIADDHSMVRKGIKLLLTNRIGCRNVSEADSCNGLMNELKKGGCTHLILDVIFSDGTSLEVVPIIRRLYPDVKMMIFSMQPAAIYAEVFRQYDIHYYLPKSSGEEDTVNCITRFLNNEFQPRTSQNPSSSGNPFSHLAPRELEILHYLLNGSKTNDIAKTLNLSDSTVSTFKKRIFEKTGATSLAQLFELASLNNLSFYANNPKNKDGFE